MCLRILNKVTAMVVMASSFFIASTSFGATGDRVFIENFDNDRIGSAFAGSFTNAREYTQVVSSCVKSREGRCLRAVYEPSSVGSPRLSGRREFAGGTEYTLRFDVRFHSRFDFKRGGKLHGLGPKNPTTGCKPQVADGWSVRVMWREDGEAELYIYDQDRTAAGQACGFSYRSNEPVFFPGRWQAVSLYVKTNTVGRSNGEAALYVDGERVARKTGLELRGQSRDTAMTQFMFSTFFGGNNTSWSPDETSFALFDNIVVVEGKSIRSAPLVD